MNRILGYAVALFVAFIMVSPNAAASLEFNNEYEAVQTEVFADNVEDTGYELNLLDSAKYNNYNLTVYPFMNDTGIGGVVDSAFTLPTVVSINRTAGNIPAYGENFTFSWLWRPNNEIVFDSLAEVWIRLPVNNITLDAIGTTQIRLSVERLFSDGYNITLGERIDDITFDYGAHGDTPHDSICDNIVYSYADVYYSNITDYVRQDRRFVNWSAEKESVITNYSVQYNFTYVKLNDILFRDTPYLISCQLTTTTVDTSKPEYEMLLTHSDINEDGFYGSHIYVDGVAYNFSFDFDTAYIITETASAGTGGLGFVERGNDTEYLFFLDVSTAYNPALNLSVQLPLYSLVDDNISVAIGLSFNESYESGSYSLNGYNTLHIHPGTNVLTLSENVSYTDTAKRVIISVVIPAEITNRTGFFILRNENLTGYAVERLEDLTEIYYFSNSVVACYFTISASVPVFFPLDKFFILLVPDPKEYLNTTLAQVAAAVMINGVTIKIIIVADGAGGGSGNISTFVKLDLFFLGLSSNFLLMPFSIIWKLARDSGLAEGLLNWAAGIFDVVFSIAGFIWGIVQFVVNAISWLAGFAMQFAAVFMIAVVYVMLAFMCNGLATSVLEARKGKKKEDVAINLDILRIVVNETWETTRHILALTLSFTAFLFSLLLVVLKIVFPLA